MVFPLWERSLLFLFPAGKTKQKKRCFCFSYKSPLSGGLRSAGTCRPPRRNAEVCGSGQSPSASSATL